MNRRAFLSGLTVFAFVRPAAGHPVHSTSTVADLRGRVLEVTLTVTPEDLQEALRRISGQTIRVDEDPRVDALAHRYIEARFVVAGPAGAIPIMWVGSEIEADAAHLYFQFTLPAKPAEVTVRNAVFFDIAPAQINRVQIRRGKRSQTMRFRATDPAKVLQR